MKQAYGVYLVALLIGIAAYTEWQGYAVAAHAVYVYAITSAIFIGRHTTEEG